MKNKIFLAAVSAFILCMSAVCSVSAADYYVSNSTGNDANDGLSEQTPWKSLEKVSSQIFNAGDNIYLKAGDEWNETLFAKGEGNSNNWITLTSYGEGAKPKISPGNNATYGIFLEDYAGWKLVGLEVCNAQAGIRTLVSKNPEVKHDGMWYEDLYVHHIMNAPITPDNIEPGLYMSYGVSTFKVLGRGLSSITNVTMKNCLIEDTDAPVTFASINNLFIENVTMQRNYKEGILFSQINETDEHKGYMKNCKILYSSYPKGMHWGTTGVQFNSTINFEMSDCEVAYTRAPGNPDGCGLDFEGNDKNITLRNNYFHDNDGTAIMIYKNPTWGSDNEDIFIIDNVMENNGLKQIKTEQSFLRHKYNTKTKVHIEGNKIKVFEGQPAVSIEEKPLEIKVENGEYVGDWPTEYYTAKGNTIEIVPPGEYAKYNPNDTGINTRTIMRWDFDEDTEGFFEKQGLSPLVAENGVLKTEMVARDPYFYSPPNLGIDLNKNTVIKIRLKQNTKSLYGQIFFVTKEATTWNKDKSKFFFLRSDSEFEEYIVDLQHLETCKGTLEQFRIDPIDNNGALGEVEIDYIEICENLDGVREVVDNSNKRPITKLEVAKSAVEAVTKEYGWDFDSDTEGWTATKSGAVSNMRNEKGNLSGDITARDPYLMSPDNLGYNIDNTRYVGVKFKNDTGRSSAKIYFRTGDEKFNDTDAVSTEIAQYDDRQRLYIFDMSKAANWKGTLRQLRFDPIDNADGAYGAFEIDYIYIGNEGEAPIKRYVPEDVYGHWAYDEILYMIDCGAVEISEGEMFKPDEQMTRAKTAAMIARAFKLKKAEYSGAFDDVTSDMNEADDIEAVLNAGIMIGGGESFYPDKVLTRQEAAQIVSNVMKLLDANALSAESETSFTDDNKIAAWAKQGINSAVRAKIINGMPSGSFEPESSLTRAQLSALIYRTIEWNKGE